MRKWLFLSLFITLSSPVWSACEKWELKGWVREKENNLHLVVAEKTMSEKSLLVYFEASPQLAPYKKLYVKAEVKLNGKDLFKSTEIKKIFSVKEAVPDPLNQNASTEMKCLN